MAFTVKLLQELPSAIASALKTYLDGQTISTLHSISSFKSGAYICVIVVFE